MSDLIEFLFYLGGSVLVWSKLGSILLALGLILFGCYKFNKALARIRLLRSYLACQ